MSELLNPESEPRLTEKVTQLHEVLEASGVPHAFGGALAAGYYGKPRGTVDIDVAIFLPPEQKQELIDAATKAFEIEDVEDFSKDVNEHDQALTHWGRTRIDFFFEADEFHKTVAERVRKVPFEEGQIPIISAEDILIFKTLYDRPQDWVDIDTICQIQKGALDSQYMEEWLHKLVGTDDRRVERLIENVAARQSE